MDPITGIGLTASVVQLVQFSIDVAKTCHQLYQDGSTDEHLDADFTAKQLSDLTSSLQHSLAKQGTQPSSLSREEKQLLEIARKCEATAIELQNELRKLQTRPQASAFVVARKAARSIWKKKSIVKIQEQLNSYRILLETSLLQDLREHFNAQSLIGEERYVHLDDTLKDIIVRLGSSQTSLTALVQRESEYIRQRFTEQALNDRFFKDLIQSLFFPDINFRQEQVANEFDGIKHSYEWIFDEPLADESKSDNQLKGNQKLPRRNNFQEWLRTGNSVYWINGKAGSGKSTLMNYICNHENKNTYLRQWSADRLLLTPTFFFWNAGARQHKTIDGLLRSTIYQMLTECPQLITCFTNENLYTWTEKRLLDTFVILLTQTKIPLATCLFIDGLDEFEGRYDPLVDTIDLLANQSNVKICLSSRPLLSFERAFATKPSLRLQELTFDSISAYALKQLLPLIEAKAMDSSDDKVLAMSLLQQIVSRAEGVFLWVVIAVRDVRDGLNDIVDLRELTRVIDEIPSEIESLYMRMLNRIKPAYQRRAARVLQILILNTEDLDLLRLYFIQREQVSQDIKLHCDKIALKTIVTECHSLKTQSLSHSRGLWDLVPSGGTEEAYVQLQGEEILFSRLSLSHRTVQDFLLHNATAKAFMAAAGVDDDQLRLSIARGTLAYLVYISRGEFTNDSLHADPESRRVCLLLDSALTQIAIVERQTGVPQLNLMNSLSIYSFLPKGFTSPSNTPCIEPHPLHDQDAPTAPPIVDLIGMAVKARMFRYICHVLDLSIEEPHDHQMSSSDLLREYSSDRLNIARRRWCAPIGSCTDSLDYDQWIRRSLLCLLKEGKPHNLLLAPTYLLALYRPHVTDPNLAEGLTFVRTLLRANASPMVIFDHGIAVDDRSCSPNGFWFEWLVLLRSLRKDGLAEHVRGRSNFSSNSSICVDPRVTLDGLFETTKLLLAQGADINYVPINNSKYFLLHPLERRDLDYGELNFEINTSVMHWLGKCFGELEEFRTFAAAVESSARKPWRKIVSIFKVPPNQPYLRYRRVPRGLPRAYPNEDEAEMLWSLIEEWERSGHWRDLDALRKAMRLVFKAHCPKVKLKAELDGEMDNKFVRDG